MIFGRNAGRIVVVAVALVVEVVVGFVIGMKMTAGWEVSTRV